MFKVKHILICILLLIFCFSLSSCHKKTGYERIKHVNYSEIFDVKDDEYYIFIYRPTCEICSLIEDEVCGYAKKAKVKRSMPKLYVLNKGDTEVNGAIHCKEEDYKDFVGATRYTQIHTNTSPFLIKIKNGKVTATFDAKTLILEELNSRG